MEQEHFQVAYVGRRVTAGELVLSRLEMKFRGVAPRLTLRPPRFNLRRRCSYGPRAEEHVASLSDRRLELVNAFSLGTHIDLRFVRTNQLSRNLLSKLLVCSALASIRRPPQASSLRLQKNELKQGTGFSTKNNLMEKTRRL